jgi:hypothetical protein
MKGGLDLSHRGGSDGFLPFRSVIDVSDAGMCHVLEGEKFASAPGFGAIFPN